MSNCLVWTGATNGKKNYGMRWDPEQKKARLVHVLAYEAVMGPVPEGLEVEHLCVNTLCYNFDHLETVTPAENYRRRSMRQTHCKRNHAFTAANTYVDALGKRSCRICKNMLSKRWRAKQNA